MRCGILAAVCVVGTVTPMIVGCSDTNPAATLTITPSNNDGTFAVSSATAFTAVLTNSTTPTASVSWSVTGDGSISDASGLHTSYIPKLGSGAATLTATAGGLSASVKITSSPVTLTGATIPGLTAAVTVQYDAEDIPHIQCSATLDCIAVQGYIQARDRFFPMDFLRHVATSHLAELIGVAGLSQDIQLRTLFKTRAGHRIEDDLVTAANKDPVTAGVLSAFVGGVNAYIAQMRAGTAPLPGEYAQLPFPLTGADIADWRPQDSLAMARLQQFQLSETLEDEAAMGAFAAVYGPTGTHPDDDKFQAWLQARQPKTEQAHTLEATPFTPPAFAPPAQTAMVKPTPTKLGKLRDGLVALNQRLSTLHQFMRRADASVGSNNWVVAGAISDSGKAMVANDPHLGLQYPPLFHLSVMTSSNPADNLNLAGGAFPGIPGALVGRGNNVGWGVTVVGYDVTDLYMETLVADGSSGNVTTAPTPTTAPCTPTAPCVMYKSAPEHLILVPLAKALGSQDPILVRTGPGASFQDATTLATPPVTVPLVVSIAPHHGPVIQQLNATTVISARWTGQEGNTQDFKAIFGLNTAHNVDEAVAALKFFSTGAQNFVLADDQGNIAYDPHALVPVRNFADPTKVGANAQPPWLPLHGADGSAEWGDGMADCASATDTPLPATCWLTDTNETGQLPFGKNPAKGYFFTANADPIGVSDLSNDPTIEGTLPPGFGAFALLGAYPTVGKPYMSYSWDDSTGFRATRIEQMIEAAKKAHTKISLADMQAIQSDHMSRPGAAFKPFIDVALQDPLVKPLSAGQTLGQSVLNQWAANGFDCPSGLTGSDPKNSPVDATPTVAQNSAGCMLFHTFLRFLLTNVFTDDLAVAGQSVDGLHAIKAMLSALDSNPDAHVKANLGSTFCQTVGVKGTITCNQQVGAALDSAVAELTAKLGAPSNWVWGRVHTIQPVSLLQLVTTNYQPGPYARPGGAFTVDVGNPSVNSADGLSFPYVSGGNVRHISVMDPTTPQIKMQLPGPERDGPTTSPGPNLLGGWVSNTYFDFAIGSQINSVAVSSQTFDKTP